MASKSHMEKVLREEGWDRDNFPQGELWYQEGDYPIPLGDAYRIAMRRRTARERRDMKKFGFECVNRRGSKYVNDRFKGWYTKSEALKIIQLERGKK